MCCVAHGHPTPLVTLGVRVRDAPARRWLGYHPSKGRSERHTTAPRSVGRPPQLSQNGCQDPATPAVGPQGGVGLPTTGSSRRRSGGGTKKTEIAFRGGWHRLETPQLPRRQTQTRQAPPARASSRGVPRCWVDTTPPEGRPERHTTSPTSVFYRAREP